MLKQLTIKNYALIQHLELEPSSQLNVVTGETGAGKSIMLGALGLLLGNRADNKTLWDAQEKCVTEGVFDIKGYGLGDAFQEEDLDYNDLTVIRREIAPNGKSRAFINDTPVTLETMKRIGGLLMDIHSQHETLQLNSQVFQLKLMDSIAENQALCSQYSVAWKTFTQCRKAFETLEKEAELLRKEGDFVRFQWEELEKASLMEGEQEKLEDELKVVEHAEEIKIRLNAVLDGLQRSEFSSRNSLAEARNQIQHIAPYSQPFASLHQRMESLIIELDDILNELEKEEEKTVFDPVRLEWVKERMSVLYHLMKKHQANDVPALISTRESLRAKTDLTENLDEELQKKKQAFLSAQENLLKIGKSLSDSRKGSFDPLCKKATELLKDLGIPHATLQVVHQINEPGPSGLDKVDMMFSANKGISPRPLAQVASGGEFSRLMFAVKYIMAEKTAMPTLILDEIDNGVSGEIAIKLGKRMKEMAKRHQVITITHLPQVASQGNHHFYVYKNNSSSKTASHIRLLSSPERIEEIAKMIGGDKPSPVALENAKELLNN